MRQILHSISRFIHHWIGYIFAFPFYILCFTGSLAIFADILQQWMQPEINNPPALTISALKKAGNTLLHAQTPSFLRLPTSEDPVLRLWHYNGKIFEGPALNPATGTPYTLHEVIGGNFFITLHSCFYMPEFWGRILVFCCALAFLCVFLSGIILHIKRFFPDLLLYRPNSSPQRHLLDLHLLSGTLSLPIFSFILLSSVFLSTTHLPLFHHGHHLTKHSKQEINATQPSPPKINPQDFSYLYQKAQQHYPSLEGGFFIIIEDKLFFYAPDRNHFCLTRNYMTKETSTHHPACSSVKSVMLGLHNFRWATLEYRLFYALAGFLGCLLSGTSLNYYTKKLSCKKNPPNPKRRHYSLFILSHLQSGFIWGLPLAIIFLLISTRLPTPFHLPPILWQETLFFLSWLASFFLPPKLPTYFFMISSALFPVIDFLTRPVFTYGDIRFLVISFLPVFISFLFLLFQKYILKRRKTIENGG